LGTPHLFKSDLNHLNIPTYLFQINRKVSINSSHCSCLPNPCTHHILLDQSYNFLGVIIYELICRFCDFL
jgi:hypothetical protein